MNSRNNSYRGFGFYLMLILIVVGVWYFLDGNTTINSYTRAAFEKDIQSGDVTAIDIVQNREIPTGSVNLTFSDSTQKVLIVSDVNEIVSYLQDQNITYYTMENVPAESWIMTLLPYLIIFGAMFIFFMIMTNQAAANAGGGGSKMMNFGKSRAKLMQPDAKKVTFSNVAGLKEEKEELEEIVDFLRAPQKYTALGARIPKGVLLVGPPGTGKTLLAKAIAGEAGMGGGHDEREQTLNQMLVEMDGFGVNEGIIVMAATNRVDILDPAIMRPGRFDRKVYVGRPDIGGREEILAVHAKNKPLGDDVDLKQIAQTTAGFTGADLENLLNEAAIIAAKENRAYITQNDIKKSFVKVGIGAEKKSRIISDKEKRITAFHEAGHAILFHALPDVGPVYSVSIIPTGAGAAGYTMPLPEKDEMFNTKGKMLQDITVSLGGRVAEELVFDDITTGASQDIKQATKMAKAMVTRYGMSENVGLICYDNDDDEVFIGRDLAHTRGYGEGVATAIDQEVKRIIDECYAKARQIITENRSVLDACAKLLLEKEKISQKEFEALFETDHVVL